MKIEFIPFQESKDNLLLKPIPSIKKLPQWYKDKSPFLTEEKKLIVYPNYNKNISIKWCNPFGDALGSGYYILLENDVQVTRGVDGMANYTWFRGGDGFVGNHNKEQISPELIPQGFDKEPWKFINFWGIKTPPGYSTLFTHPMNRNNEPFLTLSGVVDTDTYHQPVNFPFLIKSDFEGILEAGTPISQIIPFKRESWKAVINDFDPQLKESIESNFIRKINRPYKMGYWKRKDWK